METLQLRGVGLGMAALAGINLYLTVFATGLAIQQQWIVLSPNYAQLEVLGHPAIVVVAGILYFIEFFADKFPWVDSLWDSIHTVIRPVGAALLAVRVLGQASPVFDVIIALLAGSTALLTHGTKAGTRLVANTSPEPFSNVALSLGEDALVLAGLGLIHWSPVIALLVVILVFSVLFYFVPKLWRSARVILWLIWRKLNAPARDGDEPELPVQLSSRAEELFSRLNLLGEKVEWAVPCVSGSSNGLPPNVFGYLIATSTTPHELHFVANRGTFRRTLDLRGFEVSHQSKFLSENILLRSKEKRGRYLFLFDRTARARVEAITLSLQERLSHPVPQAV